MCEICNARVDRCGNRRPSALAKSFEHQAVGEIACVSARRVTSQMLRLHPSRPDPIVAPAFSEIGEIEVTDVVVAADMISRLQMQLAAPH